MLNEALEGLSPSDADEVLMDLAAMRKNRIPMIIATLFAEQHGSFIEGGENEF